MNDILAQYYQGITQQLCFEVEMINSIFKHSGVKGEGNEFCLRDLISRFIPKQYGVGSGIIIDRNGNQSRQCDIVIYDTFLYPSFLSITTSHIYPVDLVYAIIEVKTTLTSTSAKESIENIKSVRQLDIIPDEFILSETGKIQSFSHPRGSDNTLDGGIYLSNVGTINKPNPPIGCVFAYKSNVKKFKTYKSWFVPKDKNDAPIFPTLVGCLDQGIVKFDKIHPYARQKPKGYAYPVLTIDQEFLKGTRDIEEIRHDRIIYPVKQIKNDWLAIDQGKTLLLFILFLCDILKKSKINPDIRFSDHYLGTKTLKHVLIE
jgi:hypothetical protein